MGEGWGQLMHFDSYIESLKVSWFRKKKLQSKFELCNTFFSSGFGSDYLKNISNGICNMFWKKTLMAYSDNIDNIRKTHQMYN